MVITGADKDRTGEILRVDARNGKVLVQGVNRVYEHMRPSRQHPQGGRIQKEMPIDISNVLPLDPETNLPTRTGIKVNPDGARERIAKRSGKSLGKVTRSGKQQ